MREIDRYSYCLGAADCFCEMVRAGVKELALSHPCNSKQEMADFLPEFRKLCDEYGVYMYEDYEPLLSDLFPVSLNKNRFNVIFYSKPEVLEKYLALKADKQNAVDTGTYTPEKRREIAVAYGKLLSYTDEGIERLIRENNEKE